MSNLDATDICILVTMIALLLVITVALLKLSNYKDNVPLKPNHVPSTPIICEV